MSLRLSHPFKTGVELALGCPAHVKFGLSKHYPPHTDLVLSLRRPSCPCKIRPPPPALLTSWMFCEIIISAFNFLVVAAETSDWFHSRHIPRIYPAQPA